MVSGIGEYRPDFVAPPGWLLEERLEIRGWSQAEFARRCGRSPKLISEIISGKAPIEPETALQFEKVLDLEAIVWINLESNYQLHLARQREEKLLASAINMYLRFPINDLVKWEWMEKPSGEIDGVKKLLSFLGVGSVDAWKLRFAEQAALYRHSKSFKSSNEAVCVWLRKGWLEAEKQECANYDAAKFKDALIEIKAGSRSNLKDFIPRMQHLCNRSGVAFVLVPPVSKSALSGAACWATPTKAVIQQSLRGRWNDLFWFTFFHEAAHILKHGRKNTFVDEDRSKEGTEIEEEANRWAADFLISRSEWKKFLDVGQFSAGAIQKFAMKQGIPDGVVVGRLQHEKLVGWGSVLNKLKERYVWEA